MSATAPQAAPEEVKPADRPRRVATPTILQMEAVECGAASLAMMLAYHERYVSLPELRVACGVSRDGSKAVNILKAARGYGLEAKGYKKELGQLFALDPPFIVYWHFNHFLVVDGWDAQHVHLNDPAAGKRKVTHDEFDAGFTGVVLLLKPGPDFKPGGIKPELWPAIRDRLLPERSALLYCALAGVLLAVPNLAIPVFTQIFVDAVLIKGFEDWVLPLIAGLAIAGVLRVALRALQQRALSRLSTVLAVAMSSRFLWHVLRLPATFFAQRFAGEVAGRVQINERVAKRLSGPIALAGVDAVMALIFLAAMAAYDLVLAGVATVLVAANFAVSYRVNAQLAERFQKIARDQGKAQGVTVAGLQTIETLKASGLESDFFARWAGYAARASNSRQAGASTNQLLQAMPGLLAGLASLAVLLIGGLRVMDGALSIGMLIGFQSLMSSFMAPVGRLIGIGSTLTEMRADLDRLDDVLGHPAAALGEPGDDPLAGWQGDRLSGHVELRDLTFGFSQHEPPLIEGLSLTLRPGQRVAFVGGSGSGKSTVAKLIVGLYQPWSGEVRFDGVAREKLPRAVVAASLAMVDQDLFMFAGSVRDNLTLWDATVADADVVRACRDADVFDVVAALPGGLDASLAEGASNLSGGQRQRLEIARALGRDPSILVLDEATSALDSESERAVDAQLRKRGCTCIIIAHRLSTIRDCDEIIVFDRGRVTQRGTHDELKAQDGHYARLIRAEGGALQEASA